MGQHVWLTGANILHTPCMTFNPHFPISVWKKTWLHTWKHVHQCSFFYPPTIHICGWVAFYDNARQGAQPEARLSPTLQLNVFQTGNWEDARADKRAPKAHVDLSVCVLYMCMFVFVFRPLYSDWKRTIILLISGITDVDSYFHVVPAFLLFYCWIYDSAGACTQQTALSNVTVDINTACF